ncbi:hypothetical protein, partial [Bacteroides fragilis]|uniref:hypothetical protein n=1 Tax=Bacteroides fragilis TaxID=817 RepID=UPI001E2BBAB2
LLGRIRVQTSINIAYGTEGNQYFFRFYLTKLYESCVFPSPERTTPQWIAFGMEYQHSSVKF